MLYLINIAVMYMITIGPEYGTTQGGWKGVLTEAERVADLHIQVKEKLIGDVQNEIKQWRGENFHKPMVGPCKETKELEDGFRKVSSQHLEFVYSTWYTC